MNMLSLSIAKNKFYSFCNGVKYHHPKMVLNIAFTRMTKINLHEKFGKRIV